ncbi:cystathionine beta-lyase [Rubrivivax rivuli]|uniref:Cystathionine beta-lyase n=1 Tax=Rubrivivax rivuli TaxID=1862385 RepID=A0A437RHK0_9BURK|nr:cystathionine beta-lyase [Rubrivivax rivuli]RVU46242.1 cystathionine beta-lyase [Rubrivivax rivuli]
MARDLSTELIHHAYKPPAGFAAPQEPVHKASTVVFPNVAALRARDWRNKNGYTYGLHGTPTTFTLEERIATLEGGTECVLAPSGLAAVALVGQALLSAGDEVLLPDNVYGPSLQLARGEFARWRITHRLYDPMDAAGFAALLGPNTKLVWLEAPGSVTMEFPDLAALAAAAKARGVATALDNTWGAGIALRGFEHGIDIAMQALTKFPSGGGDVLMGSVVTRDAALHERIKLTHMRLGLGVAGNDAELVLRSLATMPLRYAAQDAAGRALATWLGQRPEVAQVLHPALPGSPGHEHWQRHCTAAAGLFSVMLHERYSTQQVEAFVDALQLFRIGYSWAGPVSLVVPYELTAMRSASAAHQPHLHGHLVRFSIGLESVADLQADLAQALERALR